jgi:hypothetical protein
MPEPWHVHTCPVCFRTEECADWCDVEPDLGTVQGLPQGAYVACDACEAQEAGNVSITIPWAMPHDPGDGSECPGRPYVEDGEIRCENQLCCYRGRA